ncbi:hypothetical protein F8M41_012267 [Gigaspora margarita]|uniref:F-box domain-containing protein n=1 Tax=Gigaspora margarita TaxID=4874 RepID=A0A8H4EV63_GIGMA|nr:hypothetical protein F8M41_012267 [Gigaspora margarita]
MTSKIFMGDMPELMEKILNNVNNDEFYSLYPCALVSRHWCKMSIPILWRNPFLSYKSPLFISQYLLSLDENVKSVLKEFGINSEILHLFGRNERFFSQLKELSLAGISGLSIKSAIALSEILARNTTNINVLNISEYYSGYGPQLLHAIVCIIKSQVQLREFRLIGEENPKEFHVPILEKSGKLIQRLNLESDGGEICEESLLLSTLKSFCPNITNLNISTEELEEEEELKMRVIQFAKILPLTLQYLDLRYSDLSSYIDILLNNCYAPLKTLLIHHIYDKKTTKALIKICIRKRTLNYVSIDSVIDNIEKEVEGYYKVVPSHRITVYC